MFRVRSEQPALWVMAAFLSQEALLQLHDDHVVGDHLVEQYVVFHPATSFSCHRSRRS
jgi:hypothetical protein